MDVKLTADIRWRVEALFSVSDRAHAELILVKECGSSLPFCKDSTPEQLERIRFAALKLSNGSIAELKRAVTLAREDWRDLLMAAGLGTDIHAHQHWVPTPRS